MNSVKWNPAYSKTPTVGGDYLVAAREYLTTAEFGGKESDTIYKDGKEYWRSFHNKQIMKGITHWAELPVLPNKPQESDKPIFHWNKTEGPKLPIIENLYLVANKFFITVATYKPGNKWKSYFEDVDLMNVTHWAELPANPNNKTIIPKM